ncbi:phosphoglycerate mutase 1 family [Methanococcus vannielii SB]|uniref:2,3-bisphosphoglycerate-dependent phosphoglycerate mutase n=1 Tax=Methanococcus vannielii (strain ATCC 35089 / DSM 1224 / JCM 13029 / OCM 148 / SB) TaxID=406327 RepID=GPMA_METVS|nr:2,3-bisphosphoglycerate-dependent phosphoglycerate mutase [Methanococcus vannielii]A6US15.1 RecName: Full=2,3-bisphosphoglycerate-dependent phosphoglycerate mutase; Short=BPG-dependent PGAM; Short=PGAM; Short=Phosphoglyceromutase; Short=dPGM [Methanococcus vannielii SB]ABR55287.1 phosphoglycerate mutase 1 family [Methanococcus vannielii SB]
MANLVFLRHGESIWNKMNIFTGWVDVPLSKGGVKEAKIAGKLLKSYKFDVAYSSELIRALNTLILVMQENKASNFIKINHDSVKMKEWGKVYGAESINYTPVYKSWELNERYYGKLQGLNKERAKEIYGKDDVFLWRRSYETAPPNGESLKDTYERTVPYLKRYILPTLTYGKDVIVTAHGNSLRSIIAYLEKLNSEEVLKLEIPTGVPLVYNLDEKGLKRLGYLNKKGFDNELI